MLFLYCNVNSILPTVTVSWTKDAILLVQDVPHIRLRASNNSDSMTLLLIIDSFEVSDDGIYQCWAQQGGNIVFGEMLSLTGTGRVIRGNVITIG